jgi:hypothetical protein
MVTTQAKAADAAHDQPKKRPVETIRRYVGGATVDVAIFDREIKIKTAGGGTYSRMTYFVTVSKSWKRKPEDVKDGESRYGSSSVFNPGELLELADAILCAHKRCLELTANQGDEPEGEEQPF